MGAKDSKSCCISYEDAVRRVSEAELKRLRDAFKRPPTSNGPMTKVTFIKEVLGDGVPAKLAEHVFQACGGTQKGIGFRDLVCGLVLLTRGTKEEKSRFIFGLYANEAGTHVLKEDMVKLVQACEGGYIPEAVADCFLETEKVPYNEFCEWLSQHPNATSLTRWLLSESCSVSLSNDLETPTFYQTLAGVTHLEESDIIELEKRYWTLKACSRSGKFDLETLMPLICPPVPPSLCEGFFNAFDENRDGHIDFKEMACGVSACCRGPVVERQKICFKIFDRDRDGALNRTELEDMIDALTLVRSENGVDNDGQILTTDSTDRVDSRLVVDNILDRHDANRDGTVTLDEYLVWSVDHLLPQEFLDLLFQVCHVVLGLRPASKREEGDVVRGWVTRENRHGLQPGQLWYLVSMDWWRAWNDYIDYQPEPSSGIGKGPWTQNDEWAAADGGGSLPGSLKRTKLQRKTAAYAEGTEGSQVVGTSCVLGTESIALRVPTPSPVRHQIEAAQTTAQSRCDSPNQSPWPNRRLTASASGSGLFQTPQRPGAIDNSQLVVPSVHKVSTLTGEGGKLRRNTVLMRGRDFELLPDPVWKALFHWYGGSPALPRQVVLPAEGGEPQLELYPLCIRLLKHQVTNNRLPATTWSGMVGGYGYGYSAPAPAVPKRYLAYVASCSRVDTLKRIFDFLSMKLRIRPEDMRLWLFRDENNMTLLEEENSTLEELGLEDNDQVLIEVRNKDQTWPEEMSLLIGHGHLSERNKQVSAERGAAGLNNLGNTCFMNAALQCVSNTRPLTAYFIKNLHLYELNRANPLGMKGHVAKRYGDLVQDLWSGSSRTVVPLHMRCTIAKYAPRFDGYQQHDSQELLAFLLDGLHEDLNRVQDKPYIELKDSDGRDDVVVAREAWENHILRNKSIIVDLFHGQLKSCVRCKVCGHESVRFDPFTYLSLPLPMESCVHVEVVVIRLDGSRPVKYGIRLNVDEKYSAVKRQLSALCQVPADQLMLTEVDDATIKNVLADDPKVKPMAPGRWLYAYEIPRPVEMMIGAEEGARHARTKEMQTLTQIQRMERSEALGRCYLKGVGYQPPAPDEGVGSDDSSQEIKVRDKDSEWEGLWQFRCKARHSWLAMFSGWQCKKSAFATTQATELEGSEPACSPVKHSRNPSSLSTASMTSSIMSSSTVSETADSFQGCVIAFHRKVMRQDVYYLSSQKTKPSLFGLPLVLPCHEMTTHQDLYRIVWVQVTRLVSPLPPSEANNTPNHAQDCDDSLGYEYPFTLKAVQRDGLLCAWCPWYRFCRGCKLECCDADFNFATCYIAIDWDPTALHLRYQTAQEKAFIDHSSVERARRLQTEPIDLDSCLRAFTKEEELGEGEKYYCSKCKQHQLASKMLQIWRLPPILIVHLKRFQLVNGRWVKSHKIVRFPFTNLDPTKYLATVPPPEQTKTSRFVNGDSDRPSGKDDELGTRAKAPVNGVRTSLVEDLHEHQLKHVADPRRITYNLYAISCHSGILGGGHYVCYACNPNDKWYCYNDSSCKEVFMDQIDSDSAYMLFYEREGIDHEKYMPDVEGKAPNTRELDNELDSDMKRQCTVQ